MRLLIDNKEQQIVIKPDLIAATIVNWLDNLNKQHYRLKDDTIVDALNILALTRYPKSAEQVKPYLASQNPKVRSHAYQAMILSGMPSTTSKRVLKTRTAKSVPFVLKQRKKRISESRLNNWLDFQKMISVASLSI